MALLTGNFIMDALCILIGLSTLFYYFAKYIYSYWDRKGFKTMPNCSYLFGHFTPAFKQAENIGEFVMNLYKKTSEPFVGIYGVLRPMLLVRDPELVRHILVKDFNSFTDRGAVQLIFSFSL